MKKNILKSRLIECKDLGHGYFINWFECPEIAKSIFPGQFIMLETNQFLNRPLSIYDVKKDNIGVLYKIFGKGTDFLSKLEIDSKLNINGPLGKGFTFPEDKNKKLLLVAGGIGIATFPYVAKYAKELGYKIKILYGARSKDDLVCLSELSQCAEVITITDDGSSGKKGFVTELLENELDKNPHNEIMACGPSPMLNSVISICNKFNINAQISYEEYMACGYGVCMSCVIMRNGKYVRTCIEGPVMNTLIF